MTTTTLARIAVIGATGQQGISLIDALRGRDIAIRALVRNPDSTAANELRDSGIEIVKADQEDAQSVAEGLADVDALFYMTTFEGPDGTDGEVRRGHMVADAAARAGVSHVVYSSVGGAERGTAIPHFDSKYEVEKRLTSVAPATILRPTFFMENLSEQLTPDADGDIVIRLPMPGNIPLQMISVRDIGRAAARLLLEPGQHGNAVEVAGDELTLDQVAAEVSEVFGIPARFEPVPLEYLGEDEDLKAMFRWFAEGDAYQADLAQSRSLIADAHDLRSWLFARREPLVTEGLRE